MKRSDVVTVADRSGKPLPAMIVQTEVFAKITPVTICPITSVDADCPAAIDAVRLDRASWIEIDKITTVRRTRIGATLGRLSPPNLPRLTGALALFLGLG